MEGDRKVGQSADGNLMNGSWWLRMGGGGTDWYCVCMCVLCSVLVRRYRASLPNGYEISKGSCRAYGHRDCRGGSVNEFGQAFHNSGRRWSLRVCEADSDGDGYTNGMEMGDPCCCWREEDGDKVTRKLMLSDPGDPESVPSSEVPDLANTDCGGCVRLRGDQNCLTMKIKSHALLMFSAFGIVLPTSALMMRYLKDRLGKNAALQIHRTGMVSTTPSEHPFVAEHDRHSLL